MILLLTYYWVVNTLEGYLGNQSSKYLQAMLDERIVSSVHTALDDLPQCFYFYMLSVNMDTEQLI